MTYDIAYAIAQDEGNRNMKEHGRDVWSLEDFEVAGAKLRELMPLVADEERR